MQLTRFTDFGLRMLMYLSKTERDTPITIAEVAEQFDIPHNHLIKIANKLNKLGFVTAIRGRNGGLLLAMPPEHMYLGNVLRSLEGGTPLVNCSEPPCALKGQCQLSDALNEGLRAFYDRMNQYSLADVSTGRTSMAIVTMHKNYVASLAH